MGRLGWVRSRAWHRFFWSKKKTTARSGEVEANHVDQLLLEPRIVRDLERIHLPRSQLVIPPDPGHGVLADPHPLGKGPCRPVRAGVIGLLVQRSPHHLGHSALRQPGLTASTRGDLTGPWTSPKGLNLLRLIGAPLGAVNISAVGSSHWTWDDARSPRTMPSQPICAVRSRVLTPVAAAREVPCAADRESEVPAHRRPRRLKP